MIARGARWAASPADAADGADAVVTMVADDAASNAVWLGNDGAATRMKAGALAIECSTVSYQQALDLSRELRGRGFVYVDSPVTGLPDAAAAGKLTLLVGAEPADLQKARPYLEPLSTTIRHFGAVGSGTVFKLINNLIGAVQIASLAEGIAIAEQAGLDMKLVAEIARDRRGGKPAGDPPFEADGDARFLRRFLHRLAPAQGRRLCGAARGNIIAGRTRQPRRARRL